MEHVHSRLGSRSFTVNSPKQWNTCTHASVTGHLPSTVLHSGTVSQHSPISKMSNSDSLYNYSKHFCFCSCGTLWLLDFGKWPRVMVAIEPWAITAGNNQSFTSAIDGTVVLQRKKVQVYLLMSIHRQLMLCLLAPTTLRGQLKLTASSPSASLLLPFSDYEKSTEYEHGTPSDKQQSMQLQFQIWYSFP